MISSLPNNLEEYKIKASILLKLLRSSDSQKALDAAIRFHRLPHLASLSSQEIVSRKDSVKLKHALTVIALENNHASWPELKRHLEKRDRVKANRAYTSLYPKRCAGFLNEWYASYSTARSHLEQVGGYLLPYKNQFFICQGEYIKTLGLDPDDADWARIGWDWVKPAERDGWERLSFKLQDIERNPVE
jgi:hypothetical protein